MSAPEQLERGLTLTEATALNMTFMVGIGPFVVIPFVVQAMGGPQCLLAWVLGAATAPSTAASGPNSAPPCPSRRQLRFPPRSLRHPNLGPPDVLPLHLANSLPSPAKHRLRRTRLRRLFQLPNKKIRMAHQHTSPARPLRRKIHSRRHSSVSSPSPLQKNRRDRKNFDRLSGS